MDEKKKTLTAEEAKAAWGKSGGKASPKAAPEQKEAPKKKAPAKEKDMKAAAAEEKKPEKKSTAKVKLTDEERKSVRGLRIGAIVLWVLAIGCEVAAFFAFSYLNRNYAIAQFAFSITNPESLLLIGALVLDAIFCIIAAQLWKKSNRISPNLSSSALVRTLWHQLGVIMVLVCFLPIGIFLLLKTKEMNKKTRTILLVIMALLFAGSTAASVDYKQPSAEEVHELKQAAVEDNADGTVYYTRFGKSYHYDENCQALRNTKPENLASGALQDAFDANRWDPCDFCVPSADEPAAEPAG